MNEIIVELKQASDLEILVSAIRICKDGCKHLDTIKNNIHPSDKKLIERIIKDGHESTLEHIYYTFFIDGITRLCLQELVRHRIASYSVKSTRYTLKKSLKEENPFIIIDNNENKIYFEETSKERAVKYIRKVDETFDINIFQLQFLKSAIDNNALPNDKLKYLVPENFKTTLYMSINARSLRNFFKLRLAPQAHFEIRELAQKIYNVLPFEHKFLYNDIIRQLPTTYRDGSLLAIN